MWLVVGIPAAGAWAQESQRPVTQPSTPAALAEDRLQEARARWNESRPELEEEIAAVRARHGDLQAVATRPTTPHPERVQAELVLLEDRLAYLEALRDLQEQRVTLLCELAAALAEGERLAPGDPAASGLRIPQSEAEIRILLSELAQREAELKVVQERAAALERERALRQKELTLADERLAAARAAADAAKADQAEGADLLGQRSELEAKRSALAKQLGELTGLKEELRAARQALLHAQISIRRNLLDHADPQAVEAARAAMASAIQAPGDQAEVEREKVEVEQQRQELESERAEVRRRAEEAEKALKAAWQTDAAEQQRAQLELANAHRGERIVQLKGELLAARQKELQLRYDRHKRARELLALRQDVQAGKVTQAELGQHLELIDIKIEELTLQQEGLTATRQDTRQRVLLLEGEIQTGKQARQAVEDDRDPLAGLLDESIGQLSEQRRLNRELASVLDDQVSQVQAAIDAHRQFLADSRIRTTHWGGTLRQLVLAAGWLALAILACLLAGVLVRRVIYPLTARTGHTLDDYIARRLQGPVRIGLLVLGLYLALKTLTLPATWKTPLGRLLDDVIILTVTFLAMRLVDVISAVSAELLRKTEQKQMEQLMPLLRRLTRFVVAVMGICIVLSGHGYNVTTLLAGLGIGGLAFALAAQDTLSNVFGSAMIFGDQPFVVGDWIRYGQTEGIVEAIGLRSTRIRTWEDTLISVPNREIAAQAIENVSRFKARRVYVKLGITYESKAEGVEKAVQIIRDILDGNERVRPGHYIYFTDFADSGLVLMVYYFVKFTDWRTYLTARQEVNLEILRGFEKAGISIAYPTRMLHLAGDGRPAEPLAGITAGHVPTPADELAPPTPGSPPNT